MLIKDYQSIGFVGAGRTALVLAHAMDDAGYTVKAVASRSIESAKMLAAGISRCEAYSHVEKVVDDCDVVFVTVPDDAIRMVADSLPWREGQAAVHCSGALPIEVLDTPRRMGAQIGGLHPFQTFPIGQDANHWLPGSSFATEASGKLGDWLEEMVRRIGCQSVSIAPENRSLYHLTAVLSCGFVTTLLDVSCELWEGMGFSRDEALQALLPLVQGTLNSIRAKGTWQAATGPVMRADIGTLQKHLVSLAEHAPDVLPLYREAGRRMVRMAHRNQVVTQEAAERMELLLT